MIKFLPLSALVLSIILPISSAKAGDYAREYWVGTFTQSAPIPWSGRMELYYRYELEAEYPHEIEGVITWSGLGAARTRIRGIKRKNSITFEEIECLSGSCGTVVVGGQYRGKISGNRRHLRGSASLDKKGLKGTFELEKSEIQ